jgi:hypothetical protein
MQNDVLMMSRDMLGDNSADPLGAYEKKLEREFTCKAMNVLGRMTALALEERTMLCRRRRLGIHGPHQLSP